MKSIQVSVIIPTYNSQDYICECINSILKQNYNNMEIIIVDDGSTDATIEVINSSFNKCSNIKVIAKKNGGASTARNLGISVASGEYILFIDSDDLLYDHMLNRVIEIVKKDNLDVLLFSGKSFFDNDISKTEWEDYRYKGQYSGITCGSEVLRKTLDNDDNVINCTLMLIRRDIIVNNGIKFTEGIIAEDNLFRLELLLNSNRVEILNEPLYLYRIRENSVTNSNQYFKLWYSFIISAKEVKGCFAKYKINNTKLMNDFTKKYIMYGIYDGFLKCNKNERLSKKATDLHQQERQIALSNSNIIDAKLLLYLLFPNAYYALQKTYKKYNYE